jgi:type III pantothenate kinase
MPEMSHFTQKVHMLLAIDIGNTHTVIGIYEGRTLASHWRISSSATRTEDETWVHLDLLCRSAGIAPGSIRGAVIASVVPSETDVMVQMVQKYLRHTPVIVSSDLPLGIKIHYDHPRAVGADRLCNAIAAFDAFGGPAIVVDFGTATTFDVISRRGDYLGGVIAPGIATASTELHRRAARLPKIDLRFPDNVIGKETVASMQAGILFGAVDSMEGMIRRIRKELGSRPICIATGGFSSTIALHSTMIDHVVPTLVLDGARIIFERVQEHRPKGRSRRR